MCFGVIPLGVYLLGYYLRGIPKGVDAGGLREFLLGDLGGRRTD